MRGAAPKGAAPRFSARKRKIPNNDGFAEPHAVFRQVEHRPVLDHGGGVHGEYHRCAVALAHRRGGLPVLGEVDILPAHGLQPLSADGGEKTPRGAVVENLRRLGRPELHIHSDGVALAGPDFGVAVVESIAMLAVFPDNPLQSFPVNGAACAADTGDQRLHIGPAVLVQGDPRGLWLMAQHQAEKTAQLDIRLTLFHVRFPLFSLHQISFS